MSPIVLLVAFGPLGFWAPEHSIDDMVHAFNKMSEYRVSALELMLLKSNEKQ